MIVKTSPWCRMLSSKNAQRRIFFNIFDEFVQGIFCFLVFFMKQHLEGFKAYLCSCVCIVTKTVAAFWVCHRWLNVLFFVLFPIFVFYKYTIYLYSNLGTLIEEKSNTKKTTLWICIAGYSIAHIRALHCTPPRTGF